MEDDKKQYLSWPLWLTWTLANAVGWIIGMALVWIMSFLLDPLTQGALRYLAWSIVGAGVGAIFGVNHWFLFRPLGAETIGKWAHLWFLVTVAGWSLAIMLIIGLGTSQELGFAVTGAVIGVTTGIPQWFVLRPYAQRAEWWGLGSVVGWILGLAPVDLIDQAIAFSLVGVISGAITGGMMIWLLQNPRQNE